VSTQGRISIAMAVYNGERFIEEQLDSFLKQIRRPDELVVSDNASIDRTVEIVCEFAARAPFPVRLFINECNLGVTKNFERAIRECSGDIIFLSDCDDVWYPEKLSTMESLLQHRPEAGVAICDADIVDEHLRALGERMWRAQGFSLGPRVQRSIAEGRAFTPTLPALGNCLAFRAGFKSLILPFPEGQVFLRGWHDYFIAWVIICSGVAGVAFVAKPLVAYRKHGGNMSGSIRPSLANRLRQRWQSRGQRALAAMPFVLERIESVQSSEVLNPAVRHYVIRHWQARCNLPASRIARLPVVIRELVSLRYHRFSRGFLTASKDLLFVK
jgi:glycosyltransferase involved in cell wall biosynthesis